MSGKRGGGSQRNSQGSLRWQTSPSINRTTGRVIDGPERGETLLACAVRQTCMSAGSSRSGGRRARVQNSGRRSRSGISGRTRGGSGSRGFARSSAGSCGCVRRSGCSRFIAALATCGEGHSRQQGCYEKGFLQDCVLSRVIAKTQRSYPAIPPARTEHGGRFGMRIARTARHARLFARSPISGMRLNSDQ